MLKKLCILFFIIALSSCSPVKMYKDDPGVLSWEPSIQEFEELDKTLAEKDNSLLFAGSSSIRLWESIEEDMYPYTVIQRGYGGARLSDFAVYTERIVFPHKNSSAVVLFIANDITGGDNDKSPAEVLRLFRYIERTIRREMPGTPLFWIEITPTERRWDAWPHIMEANELIREFCLKNDNLYYISTHKWFLDNEGRPRAELFLADKLHLNREGYRVWTEIIKGEIDRTLNPGLIQRQD